MWMSWLKGSEFKWVNTVVGFKWPWWPPMGVNVFDAVAVWGAAYGEEEKLFCSWSKCKRA